MPRTHALSGRDWAYEKVPQKLFDAFTGFPRGGWRLFPPAGRGEPGPEAARGGENVAVGRFREHMAYRMGKSVTEKTEVQIDLFAWAKDLEEERERIADINAERAARRGYLVFATDPDISPDDPAYREVYATEAGTPNQAVAKVRPIADGRRLRAYLATGRYRDELADARWVA